LTINPLLWETPKDFFLPDSIVKEHRESTAIPGNFFRRGGF